MIDLDQLFFKRKLLSSQISNYPYIRYFELDDNTELRETIPKRSLLELCEELEQLNKRIDRIMRIRKRTARNKHKIGNFISTATLQGIVLDFGYATRLRNASWVGYKPNYYIYRP